MIMLLGRRDEPTDAVRDYADCLSSALRRQGIACENCEIRWNEGGWRRGLVKLWKHSRRWRGRWVVLHYTALMWSRRGFPLALPFILAILKFRACRTAVVFHDVYAVADSRWVDHFRVRFQERIMRHLSLNAHRAILPVPVEGVSWVPSQNPAFEFIPVGANVLSLDDLAREGFVPFHNAIPTVGVFGISTWPAAQKREVRAIVQSIRKVSAQVGELQLTVIGRGAKEAEPLLRSGFSGAEVRLKVDGLCSSREISTELSCCDALLFARGALSSRRGSGVAAIACGLPIVAFRGRETGFPLTEAGIVFVAENDADSLGNELARVLLDRELRSLLSERNLRVFREWFSWDRIADRWIQALRGPHENCEMSRSPTKLMIYSDDFWPVVGGVQSVVMTLARGFAAQDRRWPAECTVVTGTPAGAASDSQLPFRVVRNPSLIVLARLLWRSDLVHIAGPALRPIVLSLLLRKKVVVEHHGFQAICPNGLLFHEPTRTACPGHFLAGLHRECWKCNSAAGYGQSIRHSATTFLRRWSCRLVAANIVPTRSLERLLQLPRTSVISHGVAERPAASFPCGKAPKFVFVGRLVSTKGLELLLYASRTLLRKGLQFRLLIIGDGPERGPLERLCEELELAETVEFAGQVADADMEALLGDAVAAVMPSVAGEVFGLVAAESMMRGRAVIVPDAGALAEVVGDAGLKFAAGDANSLAACMEQLLRSPHTVIEVGARARRRSLERYRVGQMLDAHRMLYGEVLAPSKRPRAETAALTGTRT